MKKLLVLLASLGLLVSAHAQEKSYDTLAIVVLDHMSAIIGDLSSCKFTLSAETDVNDPQLGTVTSHNESTVWFSGPDKLLIEALGDKGHRGYWYNGTTLTWYSFAENNYVVIPVPGTTMAMIDSVNDVYGIDFPAADFFYPTLSDDLIEASDNISYEGKKKIGDQECYKVIARNKQMTVQIWVSEGLQFLPVKFIINYSGKNVDMRYEGTFSDWQLNPQLPVALFEFALPPGAREVSIMPRK